MKVLVTGATGFLGRFLCRALEGRGDSVVRLGSKECDLTRDGSLETWSGERFERIYHLAAWTQAGDFCLYHPAEQWVINQRINTNVLDWWQRSQSQAKLIAMGSSCSYDPNLELVEENYLVGTPIDSLFTYAMTKRMLHIGLMALHRQFGMKYLTLVPSTLYGPGYHTDGRQMHFIFDLIRKILRGKLHDERVVLWGDGHQKRELVYIDDFVGGLIELSDSRENEVINIGAGEEFSIRHFARLICEQAGYDFERILFDETRYVGARSKCLSVRKFRSLMPGAPTTPIEEGLERTVDWFLENREALLSP